MPRQKVLNEIWLILIAPFLIYFFCSLCDSDWRKIFYFGVAFISYVVYNLWGRPIIEKAVWGFLNERQYFGFEESLLRWEIGLLGSFVSVLFGLSVSFLLIKILEFIGAV